MGFKLFGHKFKTKDLQKGLSRIKKGAKIVSKVSKIGGKVLITAGELTGQPELIAAGEAGEMLSKGIDKGLDIEQRIEDAVRHKNPSKAIDAVGDVAKDLGIANQQQINVAKRRANAIAEAGMKVAKGDTKGAIQSGSKAVVSELGHMGKIKNVDEVEKIRGQLLELLLTINKDELASGSAPSQNAIMAPSIPSKAIELPSSRSSKKSSKSKSIDDMKVSELKIELKKKGLKVSGNKADLVKRLKG